MSDYRTISENNPALRKAFLALPKRLYTRKSCPQDRKCEEQILTGSHLLSSDFTVYPFVVLRDGVPVSRCILTVYPEDKEGYFGFFESENDPEAVKALFSSVEKKAEALGLTGLTGPVNASFWIGYRLKIHRTDIRKRAVIVPPYTGEPYNLNYYALLLEGCGFSVSERYVSNHFSPVPSDYYNKKLEKRRRQFAEKGFVIRNLDLKKYEETMRGVYRLLIELYSDFPAFRMISEEKFMKLFASYRLIVNPEMVKLAYVENQMAGFFICVPDYGNALYGGLSFRLIHSLLWTKKHAKRYVLLYLGADAKYPGLGSALADAVVEELRKNQALSIGALIHEHKVTQNYVKDLTIGAEKYVLVRKTLK